VDPSFDGPGLRHHIRGCRVVGEGTERRQLPIRLGPQEGEEHFVGPEGGGDDARLRGPRDGYRHRRGCRGLLGRARQEGATPEEQHHPHVEQRTVAHRAPVARPTGTLLVGPPRAEKLTPGAPPTNSRSMRRKPLYIALGVSVLSIAALVVFARGRAMEAQELIDGARVRLDASLTEAPELDRLQASTALSHLERARELGRDDTELSGLRHYALALTHLSRGDLVFCEGELTASRHETGWTPRLRVLAAEVARRLTDLDEARTHVAAALAADETNSRALLLRADIALDEGDYAAALLDLEVLRAAESDASVVRNRLGVALLELGRYEGARAELTEATRLSNASPDAWINLGRLERRVGDFRAAFTAFDGALDISAGDPDAHLGRGLARAALGELAHAERDFRRAAELAPNDAEPLLALGDLLRDLGRVEEGIEIYREAISRESADPASWLKLGNALVMNGEPALGVRAFTEALDRAPALPPALNGLGAALMQIGRTTEAEAMLARAAQIDEADPNPLMNLALLREREGDREGAQSAWRAALDRDPGLVVAREHLAL